MESIRLKRVYEDREDGDGFRILVDRLWPRGVKKEDLGHDLWAKEIAPSDDIRKAFNHEPDRFQTFKKDYLDELNKNEKANDFLEKVQEELKNQPVTLLYAAKDTQYNQAVVLKEWLEQNIKT